MIGAIAGDIIGSRFEGQAAPPKEFQLLHPSCRFTDDTVCTLAVAEALMQEPRDFAASLRTYVRRYPGAGYGALFFRWATTNSSAYGSWGNGAPMRTSAVGWLSSSLNDVLRLSEEQASVTHDHPDAVAASQAVALSIFCLRSGEDPAQLRHHLETRFGYQLDPAVALVSDGFQIAAKAAVTPSLCAALTASSWKDAVRRVIALGGDTDTLACITGAVAEARFGVPQDVAAYACNALPSDLLAVLDAFRRRRAVMAE
ncbi:MAG: ADP-ribosylglycohydrolase family protein [Pseudorhizobium sp.]